MNSHKTEQFQLTVRSKGEMYAAIANRDVSYDGSFVYGVVTTGVFCKPSCGARLANRENVRFFSDIGMATRAGFRPCKRCQPDNSEATRNMVMIPAAYRAGRAGERIFRAYRMSSLGPLMMAATERGVCFAQFGEGLKALQAQLEREFPSAEFVESPATEGPDLGSWIDALELHLSQHAPRPDLPLDLRGTSFQLKVWRFLLSVREGDVLSYGELAKEINKPKAVRAVGSACGANRVGVLVPCHRILRGNGELGGYRWGLERKRTLLDMERRNKHSSQ